jgi:hypothetical protein
MPCSEKVATDCLKATGWSVEGAIEHFFSSGLAATVGGIDPRAVEGLYQKYKGDGSTFLPAGDLGMMAMCCSGWYRVWE